MTPSRLVPVEGRLGRPRVTPLDGVPPFGREWIFSGASGARPAKRCLASLTTSCIDVDAPHRTCRWQPPPVVQPPSAVTTGRYIARAAALAPDRRAMHAACWSIGALGIIGWLIATHEPFTGFSPALALQTAGVVQQHAAQSTGAVRVAAVEPTTPAVATAPHIAAHPSGPSPRARDTAPRPAPRLADAASDGRHVATAAPPHRSNGAHTAPVQIHAPSARRLAPGPAVERHASRTPSSNRLGRPPLPDAPRNSLDDPLTLIAMANTLQATLPARSANVPTAGFDWTAQLSHRRLTDAPDTLAR